MPIRPFLLFLLLVFPALGSAQLHPALSEECRTVLSNLGPRTPFTCARAAPAPALTREDVDRLHGDGYFDYIWGLALDATELHGGSPGVLMALMMKESHFMPTAVSCYEGGGVAASGIAQIIVKDAGGEEAISQISNRAEPIFQEMLRERQAQDASFEISGDRTTAKFQWVFQIDSQYVDQHGIDAFNGAGTVCRMTDQSGNLRDCAGASGGGGVGLSSFPGCFEAIKEVCVHNGNIRTNLFCPNYSITLAAVYLSHLSENRARRAENSGEGQLLRAVIERYNNAGDAERNCHVHAIVGHHGGGFGGTHAATYCSYENEYLHSPAAVERASGGAETVK